MKPLSPLQRSIQNLKDERSKEVIVTKYWDEKYKCWVKCLQGVQEKPYLKIPTGYEL